ncbi:MAG: 50S ribosomal protein L29 [Candidatus Latescibacteria bacterium]|nr:50S ribosomal protein L29 [Candidatus Latescibacterota bacterium]
MKPHEIRQLSEAELLQQVMELEEERYNLEFQRATRQQTNPTRSRAIRRDLARIHTIIREHHLGLRSLVGTDTRSSGESGEQA